jgi:hypothetical protein
MNRHCPQIRHNPPGYAASPTGHFITVYKGNVRPPAKPETGFFGHASQLVEYKPHKKLGFAPVWMPKRHNAAAFSAQGLLVGPKDVFSPPQNYPCYAKSKKKVESAENSAHKKNEFRDSGFRNPDVRFGGGHGFYIGFIHALS